MVIKPSQQLDPESLAHPSMYGSTTNSNNKETLTLANSPNLSRFVHQHASESPDDTVLLVPEESPRPFAMQSPGKGWLPCTWSDLSDFIAELVLDFEQQPQIGSALGRSDHPVAAMLVSPAEDVLPVTLALVSLGYAILPINPHLSPKSIAHLVTIANASLLVCSSRPDFSVQTLPSSLQMFVMQDTHRLGQRLRTDQRFAPPPSQLQRYNDVKARAHLQVVREPAYYLHSSGSTGMPKLVPWRNTANYAQLVAVTNAIQQEASTEENRVLFLTKDLFAVIPMGLCMRVLYGGKGWTVAFPREPVLQQTTEGLLEDMMAVNASNISVYTCDAAAFVRYLSEPPVNAAHKAKQDRYAHFLRNLGPIPCGGSRIDRGLIREAIPLGIQIKSTFGTTESSAVMTSFPETIGDAWGKVTADQVTEEMIDQVLGMVPLPLVDCRFEPFVQDSQEDGITQLHQLFIDTTSNYFSSPNTCEPWWSTRDLFRAVPHPRSQQPLYVYEMRMDDMVILGNGASIHPARTEELVYDAVAPLCQLTERAAPDAAAGNSSGLNRTVDILFVGSGRRYPTLLVEGMPDQHQQNTFLQAFGAHADAINASFAAYSHLKPELFYFLQQHESLPRTVKNTVNRKKAEEQFKPQLDLLYASVD